MVCMGCRRSAVASVASRTLSYALSAGQLANPEADCREHWKPQGRNTLLSSEVLAMLWSLHSGPAHASHGGLSVSVEHRAFATWAACGPPVWSLEAAATASSVDKQTAVGALLSEELEGRAVHSAAADFLIA
mmetsp:Transcript_42321/g.83354  ORF Transcript_42321/g.83354 Transcript_42321/m.83354 type:complete len:132 (+) Transcript_42321:380-775(+)